MSIKPTIGRGSFRLQGGSAGADSFEGSASNHLFQKGVDYVYLSKKKQIHACILPARDNSLSPNDTAWKGSVVPYRDMTSGNLDKATQSPAFTPFFLKIIAYKFFGRSAASIISPQTLKDLAGDALLGPEETADPVRDCYFFLKDHLDDYRQWAHLLDKETSGQNNNRLRVLPRAKELALFNAYYHEGDGKLNLGVLITSWLACEHLHGQLCHPTPRSIDPIDPNFEHYIFGDVTDPKIGLMAKMADVAVGEMTTPGFHFSTKEFTLNNTQRVKGGVPQAILDKRYDLASSEVLQIWTYQQWVDYLVADACIPYELIQLACSGMANIPSRTKENVVTSAPAKKFERGPVAPDDDNIPMDHPADRKTEEAPTPPEEETPAPPEDEAPAPPEDAPAEPEPEPFFWVSDNGVRKAPLSEVQSLVNTKPGLKIMPEDKSGGWKSAADLGITPQSTSATTSPKEAGSSTPAAASAPASSSKLTPEEQAEFSALQARVEDEANPLQQKEMRRMLELRKKGK